LGMRGSVGAAASRAKPRRAVSNEMTSRNMASQAARARSRRGRSSACRAQPSNEHLDTDDDAPLRGAEVRDDARPDAEPHARLTPKDSRGARVSTDSLRRNDASCFIVREQFPEPRPADEGGKHLFVVLVPTIACDRVE
jgi:hypothetical protein